MPRESGDADASPEGDSPHIGSATQRDEARSVPLGSGDGDGELDREGSWDVDGRGDDDLGAGQLAPLVDAHLPGPAAAGVGELNRPPRIASRPWQAERETARVGEDQWLIGSRQ